MSPLTRILVAGIGPLPPERPQRLFAPGLRIWGIARELARAGHEVRLICAQFGDSGRDGALRYNLKPARDPRLPEGVPFPLPSGGWPALLAHDAADFKAEVAVGSTDFMNHALAAANLSIPIWMDYFGDPMAERQMLALAHNSDETLINQWSLVAPALTRADRLSGCSADQCSAILGQLGAVGRLNRHTVHEVLVERIPPWIELIPIDIDCEPLVRGNRAPQDAFIVIQTGGFNTWLDVQTLFAALEKAMAANPRIHFAATGGAIPGHHLGGYEWFDQAVASSLHRERYHLLGWLPLAQVPRVISEGDLGLNVDIDCPEGRLGTRNRLLDWLVGHRPVISTPGCELARELGARNWITLVPHGDASSIAEAILHVADNPGANRERAEAAGNWLRDAHAPDDCLAPLIKWAAAPKPASDLQAWRSGGEQPPSLLIQAGSAGAALSEARRQAEKLAWLEKRQARLEGSRLVRWALALRGRNDLDAEKPPESS